jgi:hypothetical protein
MDNPEINKSKESIESGAIKKLEDLSVLVGPHAKLLILAVYLNLKPASVFQTQFSEKPNETLDEVRNILNGLGIFSKVTTTEHFKDSSNLVSLYFAISKDEKVLEKIAVGVRNSEYHKKQGEYFGFPRSATKAYADEELLDTNPDTLPEEITNEDKKFLFFRLSKQDWRDEIVWLRKIEDAVKALSPVIHEQIMKQKENGK